MKKEALGTKAERWEEDWKPHFHPPLPPSASVQEITPQHSNTHPELSV